VKTLVRVGLVVAGAAGFCVAFSLAASADVGNPASTYRSALKIAMADQSMPAADKALDPASKPADTGKTPDGRGEAAATPAPEQVVIQAPARVVQPRGASHGDSLMSGVAQRAEVKYQEIESFLGRVASAGHDGAGAGTGVPVLVLAFVSAAAVLDRHRLRANRWATDESALELLYARELTPPG
jgi:hypothetical protein